jgi:hypothetical protein
MLHHTEITAPILIPLWLEVLRGLKKCVLEQGNSLFRILVTFRVT